jgi:hypothetical protein
LLDIDDFFVEIMVEEFQLSKANGSILVHRSIKLKKKYSIAHRLASDSSFGWDED